MLVHPISVDGRSVLPCAYGYATTVRKAQGASLSAGCLYFDHCYPAERGYGYVGASRFRSRDGLFYYGQVRRTDWLPRQQNDDQQLQRSVESESEDEQDRENRLLHGSSSEDDDSLDGDLGRICRGGVDVLKDTAGSSSSEDEDDPMRAVSIGVCERGKHEFRESLSERDIFKDDD